MENYKNLEKQFKDIEQEQKSQLEKEFDAVQKRYEELLHEVNTRGDLIIKMKSEIERLQKERDGWEKTANRWAKNWKERYERLERELEEMSR